MKLKKLNFVYCARSSLLLESNWGVLIFLKTRQPYSLQKITQLSSVSFVLKVRLLHPSDCSAEKDEINSCGTGKTAKAPHTKFRCGVLETTVYSRSGIDRVSCLLTTRQKGLPCCARPFPHRKQHSIIRGAVAGLVPWSEAAGRRLDSGPRGLCCRSAHQE